MKRGNFYCGTFQEETLASAKNGLFEVVLVTKFSLRNPDGVSLYCVTFSVTISEKKL